MSKKIGLSLSGGGYRAAAFHLGTLRKLNELGILEKVDVISTVSGGSITGAYYCLNNDSKSYEQIEAHMIKTLNEKSVITRVLLSRTFIIPLLIILLLLVSSFYLPLTSYAFLSPIILLFIFAIIWYGQFKIFPVSGRIEKIYDDFFYDGATLSMLTDKPVLAINSTNLQTSRPFTFSKRKMGDSLYAKMKPPIKFKNADFPVSRAVMASSCVPFAFTPVKIANEFYEDQALIPTHIPQLVDGGVYDNQGIHKITQKDSFYECDIIIASDAGDKMPFENAYQNVFAVLLRTMDVFMARIKHFQMMQNIYRNTVSANKEIAFFSLGWDIKNCIPGFIDNLIDKNILAEVIAAHEIPVELLNNIGKNSEKIQAHLEKRLGYANFTDLTEEQVKLARGIPTNLTKLNMDKIKCLMTHAANLTELQVRLYCPTLLKK